MCKIYSFCFRIISYSCSFIPSTMFPTQTGAETAMKCTNLLHSGKEKQIHSHSHFTDAKARSRKRDENALRGEKQ